MYFWTHSALRYETKWIHVAHFCRCRVKLNSFFFRLWCRLLSHDQPQGVLQEHFVDNVARTARECPGECWIW